VRASLGARILIAALFVIGLFSMTGCAAQNRETYMRDRAAAFVYQRPMAEVWTAAKQLLADDGYSGREVKGGWVFLTEWKEDVAGASVGGRLTRYLVEGRELGPKQSLIRFTSVLRSTGSASAGIGNADQGTHAGMSSLPVTGGEGTGVPQPGQEGIGQKAGLDGGKRDLEMEWRLLQKLEPAQAKAIEAEAFREHP
jgi:hypothetical protein